MGEVGMGGAGVGVVEWGEVRAGWGLVGGGFG